MSFFYRFVADSLVSNFESPEPDKLTPYTAVFVFSLGVLASNFIWNTWFMYKTNYWRIGNLFRLFQIGEFTTSFSRNPRWFYMVHGHVPQYIVK